MIDPRELRIGNLVYSEYDGITEVTVKLLERIVDGVESVNPIPLTEEWLFKFGFEKDVIHDCIVIFQSDQFAIEWFCNEKEIHFVGHDSTDNFENIIKHIHQLQNIYFDLSGKELKFKL